MTIFFTSDLHFNHTNILKYCSDSRPFSSVDEMNEAIINNWNSVVGQDDIVYVLGDFGFGSYNELQKLFDRLNGTKHLIRGNHDKDTVKIKGWASITDYHGAKLISITHDNVKHLVILSHFAYAVWDQSHNGSINLYGHSHGKAPNKLIPNTQQCDVGVDSWNCTPCNFSQIIERMNTYPKYNRGY